MYVWWSDMKVRVIARVIWLIYVILSLLLIINKWEFMRSFVCNRFTIPLMNSNIVYWRRLLGLVGLIFVAITILVYASSILSIVVLLENDDDSMEYL